MRETRYSFTAMILACMGVKPFATYIVTLCIDESYSFTFASILLGIPPSHRTSGTQQ